MTTVLLVRHTEVHNPGNVLYGRLPRFRLSDKGVEQAKRTAEVIKDEPVTHIYTSPLLRAKQTARLLGAKFVRAPIDSTWLLAEIASSWQGTPMSEFAPDSTVYEDRRVPGDESERRVAARMRRFLRLMCVRHPEETVVGVSHGDPIKFAYLCAQGWPANGVTARRADPARGSVSRFVFARPDCLVEVGYYDPETERLLQGDWQRLGRFDDLAPGSLRELTFGDREVLVAKTGEGKLYVLPSRCPHMRTHLADGVLEGNIITCALHGAQFDLSTGKTVRDAQCDPLDGADGLATKHIRKIGTGSVQCIRTRDDDGVLWMRSTL